MRQMLNCLYVTTQGSYLARDGEAVAVRVEGETKLRVPIHNLGGIVCFGQVSCSPPLLALCGERQVQVSFLSEYGRFWARVEGPVSGNVLLRREQFRAADDAARTAEIARCVVLAKVANSRMVLMRSARDGAGQKSPEALDLAAHWLAGILERGARCRNTDSLRGFEGDAARTYFGVFDHMIGDVGEEFRFRERSRRPPLDRVNALLSFLYTLLVHDATSALEACGLDPAVGFLHSDRPGRMSLALDLMEEFRAPLVDRLALTLINRRQVNADGFRVTASGAVEMTAETRKEVLTAWQKRKLEEVVHPFMEERMPAGMLVHAQAMLLARHLRGDLDAYPAMIWK